jgi:hypothetical protein
VRAEDQHRTLRDFINSFDENGTTTAQLLDNISVVNYFVMNVDRGTIRFQGQLHDIHRAYNAGAESSWPYPQQYLTRLWRNAHV